MTNIIQNVNIFFSSFLLIFFYLSFDTCCTLTLTSYVYNFLTILVNLYKFDVMNRWEKPIFFLVKIFDENFSHQIKPIIVYSEKNIISYFRQVLYKYIDERIFAYKYIYIWRVTYMYRYRITKKKKNVAKCMRKVKVNLPIKVLSERTTNAIQCHRICTTVYEW